MTAAVAAAAVITAGMLLTVVMVVVVAADIGIKVQCACQEQGNSLIRITANAAVKLDASLCQCHLCAAADAATDQHICLEVAQQTGQCAVTAAHGVDHLGGNDLAVFHIVDLKLGAVAKVLENISVFVSNCDSHCESLLLH